MTDTFSVYNMVCENVHCAANQDYRPPFHHIFRGNARNVYIKNMFRNADPNQNSLF